MEASSVCRRWLVIAACSAALLYSGCDKPPPTVEAFAPPPPGSTWTLKRESTGSFGSGTTFVTVERAERTWNGGPVIAFDSVSSTTLANAKGETIAITAGDTPILTFDPPFGLPWPLHVGRKQTSAHRMTQHWDNQVRPFEVSFEVEAYEDVTVPAGTSKAFRIRGTDTRGQDELRWFSPERGITVKHTLRRNDKWPSGPGTQEVALVPTRTARMPRVGFLWEGFVGGTDTPGPFHERTLFAGLRELGWINGQNVVFVHRYNKDGTEEQGVRNIEDLIRLKVDVMVEGFGALPARLTQRIPIVTLYCPDPVRLGVADSYVRPGRNVTGMAAFLDGTESSLSRLSMELLLDAVPSIRKLAFLTMPRQGVDVTKAAESWERAAKLRNVELFGFEVRSVEDIEHAFSEMRRLGVQGVWMEDGGVLLRELPRVTTMAITSRLPLSGLSAHVAAAGGLIGAGYEPEQFFRGAPKYIDRILRGAQPGDLPFEQPTVVRVAVNLRTARALGLTLPKALIVRADQVIE